MCHSHRPGPFRTLASKSGEEDKRMLRRLKKLCLSGQRQTLLLSLANTLARVNPRRPRKECLSKAMSIRVFQSIYRKDDYDDDNYD
jgi:hypothetical protein